LRQRELFGDRIRPFGMLEEVCNRDTLEGPEIENLARSLHEDYVRRESLRGQGGSSLKSWADLPEDLRRSNYHAADHFAIKLRALGLTIAGPGEKAGEVPVLDPADIEVLARMEHRRFCAERFLAGWRCDPRPKDPVNKTNPTLVPWDQLPESEKDKDREQVRTIPQVLAGAGRPVRR